MIIVNGMRVRIACEDTDGDDHDDHDHGDGDDHDDHDHGDDEHCDEDNRSNRMPNHLIIVNGMETIVQTNMDMEMVNVMLMLMQMLMG